MNYNYLKLWFKAYGYPYDLTKWTISEMPPGHNWVENMTICIECTKCSQQIILLRGDNKELEWHRFMFEFEGDIIPCSTMVMRKALL